MKLTLGFSPCPNDTFVFDAMVHGRIDTEGLEFDYYLEDVEQLNKLAFTGKPDITKISTYAYAFAAQNYLILDSGSAVGHRNGPLLISKRKIKPSEIPDLRIAIPGVHTTANLLFSIAWPQAINKVEYLFSDIEQAVQNEEVDAGLIIHEGRFTYYKRGLQKVVDMGEYWEKRTGLPVPLGNIVINRRIPEDISLKVNRIIHNSLEFAWHDSLPAYDFVVENAQEMESTVMNNHIKLYVNKFTSNLGKDGKKAISELFRTGFDKGVVPELPDHIFLTTH
jgi:1,4-dihydroxy-6-naphthoate synthase